MQVLRARSFLTLSLFVLTLGSMGGRAVAASNLDDIKAFLVSKVTTMDKGSHEFEEHATAYDQIIKAHGGDYEKAALEEGSALAKLAAKMQDDYRVIHNSGYESIEGITAGTKRFVQYDIDLDAGVPKGEATTETPATGLILKSDTGKVLVDRQGNLFHYVMEPALWGTNAKFVAVLSPEATARAGVKKLPHADVLLAAAKECVKRLDQLLDAAQSWQPTIDECVGALVWMTPTLNGYFEDWKDSRYNPSGASGRYVAESRVLDMRGIMSSLQLTYGAVLPEIARKDPALAKRLKSDYAGIMAFLSRVDEREQKGKKLTTLEIEEMANQAKAMTDQLVPKLKQVVALLNLKLPPKPTLV